MIESTRESSKPIHHTLNLVSNLSSFLFTSRRSKPSQSTSFKLLSVVSTIHQRLIYISVGQNSVVVTLSNQVQLVSPGMNSFFCRTGGKACIERNTYLYLHVSLPQWWTITVLMTTVLCEWLVNLTTDSTLDGNHLDHKTVSLHVASIITVVK